MTIGDGRRDLSVDGSPEGAPAEQDQVMSSADEPRAGERLRESIERSGAFAWAGRHRVLLGGLAVLLAVGAAGAGYVVTRPPAADPVVAISIVSFGDSGSEDLEPRGGDLGRRPYQVTAHGAGDVDTMLGIVGPGLTRPTSSISNIRFGRPGVGTLGAKADCSDSTWWGAKDADYRARVRRTDTHGRVTTYDAPLGDSPFGPSNVYWHDQVRQSCLPAFFRTLPPGVVSASTAPGRRQVDVTLTLTNPSRHALTVSAVTHSDVVDVEEGPPSALPARGTASVLVSMRIDCARGTPHLPVATALPGDAGNYPALPVYVSQSPRPVERGTAGVWARLTPASAARLDSQLAALCSPAR